jgi:hypothetical protein
LCSLLTLSALLATTPARAHGSFPEATQILLPADRSERIILATNFGLIFSEDSGKTWQFSCEQELSAYAGPYSLGAPGSQRIFAQTAGFGLVYSDDDSCTWQAARGPLSDLLLLAFVVDPSDSERVYAIAAPRYDLRNGNSIYVSDDGGLSFGRAVFTSPPGAALLNVMVAPSRPSTLFASMYATPENHPVLLRSDDSGEHWETVADLVESLGENPFQLLAIDPLDEKRMHVRILEATAEALATSDDGGLSFVRSLSIPGKLSAFLELESGTILVGGTAGLEAVGYRSTDGGQSFEPWLGAPHVHALAERSGKLYVAGDNFVDGYAIAESDDDGVNLRPLTGFNQVQAVKSCVAAVCTESCAYYAGINLWPQAVCPQTVTPPGEGEPPRPGVGSDPKPGPAEGEGGSAPREPEPEAVDHEETPEGEERGEAASLRVSGGCACDVSGGRRTNGWPALLFTGSMLLGRRKARRQLRPTSY